jgi:hypothetical protein
MIRTPTLLIVALLFVVAPLLEAQKPSWEYPTATIAGWHAQAIAIALKAFQTDYPETRAQGIRDFNSLRYYTVTVAQSPPEQLPLEYARQECVRINFVPKLKAGKGRSPNAASDFMIYGVDVRYDVCRRPMKIVKTSFTRD